MEVQKICSNVTGRPNSLRPSRREVKNDVWKYLQTIVMGLYAVCGHFLDNQDHAHSHCCRALHTFLSTISMGTKEKLKLGLKMGKELKSISNKKAHVCSGLFEGGVGYSSNERGFSVEYSLQRTSSKILL